MQQEQDTYYGRTSPEHSAVARAQTLHKWLVKWQDSGTLIAPSTVGARKAQRWAIMGYLNGALWTRNGSEWRSGAVACSLSSILETGPIDPQFFLSAKACAGILRRTAKRSKKLPSVLLSALEATARGGHRPPGTDVDTSDSLQVVTFQQNTRDVAPTLSARTKGGGGLGTDFDLDGGLVTQPVATAIRPMNSGKDYKAREVDVSQPIMAGGPVGGNQGGDVVAHHTAVRRLTPVECERLQGFPDNYTQIPWRGKAAENCPDGARYKALGNSMAVPVMHWIGRRIMGL